MTVDPPQVTIALPADTRFVSLARTAAASIAVELDFSIDEIEDLRIAVDELFTLLVEAEPSDGMVTLVYTLEDERAFSMRGSISDRRESTSFDDLTRQILDAVVDEFRIGDTDCSFRTTRDAE